VSTRPERAGAARPVDWSAIAHALGYYDQSHFVDDFKALVGLTPSRWLAQKTR
jgi:AraC-like DNA-binding protein